jgi:hypothetical protein
MGPQVGKRWSRSDPLSLVCSNQGGGRGSSRQDFYIIKKKSPCCCVCVCWIFAAMMAGRATTRPEYKKRETQLCDEFAVCGRSYFYRRSAFSRVHLFFFFYRGKVRRSLDEFSYMYMTQCCSPSCTTHKAYRNIYKKGGQKMSVSISSSVV